MKIKFKKDWRFANNGHRFDAYEKDREYDVSQSCGDSAIQEKVALAVKDAGPAPQNNDAGNAPQNKSGGPESNDTSNGSTQDDTGQQQNEGADDTGAGTGSAPEGV